MKTYKLRMSMGPVIAISAILMLGVAQVGITSHTRALLEEPAKRTAVETVKDLVYIADTETALANSVAGNNDTVTAARAAFTEVNKERKKAGLSAFKWSDALNEAAAIRAVECSKKWSHTRPDGSDYYSVNPELIFGESISKGHRKASTAVASWMKSEIHKQNLLDPSFNSIAISVYEAKDGNWYWVVEFGM